MNFCRPNNIKLNSKLKAIKNEKGKIMKPESYFKPNIKHVLGLIKD